MSNYKIIENHVELETLPKKFKKCTGTRFATIMGLNVWSTPFEAWCAITRTYEKPFEDSVYTIAGKVIEPKIIGYLKKRYFMTITTPTDVYGENHFQKTWGDFYPDEPVLGGSWDCLEVEEEAVIEIKTTKRAEDWLHGVPEYYKLQVALYTYLKGWENFKVVVAFLEEKDYDKPEEFEPTVSNTKVYEFKLSEEYPTFEKDYIEPAMEWWEEYVVTGISPEFDEKKDAEILKALRKNIVEPTDDEITALMKEADKLQAQIEKAESKITEKKNRLKEIDNLVKKYMAGQFRDGDKKVEITGTQYIWTLTRSNRTGVDSDRLKADGLYEKYQKTSETLTLKKVAKEEE